MIGTHMGRKEIRSYLMLRKSLLLGFTLAGMMLASQLQAQFTPQEIAERPKWEEFLKTAEIVKFEEIGEGVTKPTRLYLKKGDVEASGAWKNPSGIQEGYLEGWQYEIAAYELDKLLGLNMIPPTVEREFRGKKGSLQLWVKVKMNDLKRMDDNIPIPNLSAKNWERMKYLMRAFDGLIANEDRTQQNILYSEDWRTILIDHSRSFRSSKKFTERLVTGMNALGNRPLFIRELPRIFVEKIKTLDFSSIKNAVGPCLEKKEIEAILIRKKLLLDEIAELIKDKGEDKVLY